MILKLSLSDLPMPVIPHAAFFAGKFVVRNRCHVPHAPPSLFRSIVSIYESLELPTLSTKKRLDAAV